MTDHDSDRRIRVGEAADGSPVTLPVERVLTGRAFLTGKSGSGKSNTASVVIEELLDRGFPVAIVDTDGEYYGLKEEYELLHAGADEECDVQVDVEHAERLASLALEENVPIILDVSGYLDESVASELIRETARHLFAKEKKLKKPFLLVVEEVHEYVPEGGGMDDTGRMLVKVGKRGRKHGLGIVGISQRPADVKKDFITQANWLVWHRLTWNNDTRVVSRIVGDDYGEAVSDLDAGEAFLQADWSDAAVRRVRFRRKRTFDAGATPGLEEFERPDLKSVGDDLTAELASITEQQQRERDRIEQLEATVRRKDERIEELEAELDRARDVSSAAEQVATAVADLPPEVDERLGAKNREIDRLHDRIAALERRLERYAGRGEVGRPAVADGGDGIDHDTFEAAREVDWFDGERRPGDVDPEEMDPEAAPVAELADLSEEEVAAGPEREADWFDEASTPAFDATLPEVAADADRTEVPDPDPDLDPDRDRPPAEAFDGEADLEALGEVPDADSIDEVADRSSTPLPDETDPDAANSGPFDAWTGEFDDEADDRGGAPAADADRSPSGATDEEVQRAASDLDGDADADADSGPISEYESIDSYIDDARDGETSRLDRATRSGRRSGGAVSDDHGDDASPADDPSPATGDPSDRGARPDADADAGASSSTPAATSGPRRTGTGTESAADDPTDDRASSDGSGAIEAGSREAELLQAEPVAADLRAAVRSARCTEDHATAVVSTLAEAGPLSFEAVADRAGVPQENAYSLLSALRARSLVTRDRDHRYALHFEGMEEAVESAGEGPHREFQEQWR